MKMSINNLQSIVLGREKDGGVKTIEIDCSEWKEKFPQLTKYRIEVTSPNGIIYCPEVTMNEHILTWPITKSDTALTGKGAYQIVATGENGERLTSAHLSLNIYSIMPGTAQETPPEYIESWIQNIVDTAERAELAAKKAEDAAAGIVITPEEIQSAVDSYLIKNPIKVEETDPTMPDWAKEKKKPTYTAEEVGAQPKGDYALKSEIPQIPDIPVTSVNGKTGDVKLSASDVGAVNSQELNTEVEKALQEAKESGEFKGENGGYYLPTVNQLDNDKISISHSPSKEDMAPVEPVTIDLPRGPKGESGVHIGKSQPTDPNVNVWIDPEGDTFLPIATADTLGGVKVGKGLQMDGDVLGVKPEGEYELIKTITLDEEAVVMVTDLGLHNASIYFAIPATDKTGNIALAMTIGDKRFAHIGYLLAPFSATEESKGRIDVKRSSGGWRVYCPATFVRNLGVLSAISEVQFYPELRDIQTYDMFNGFTTSAALPKGTTIEIYGVRA